MKRQIVVGIIGDSNTKGMIGHADPKVPTQCYDYADTWPGVLETLLGSQYKVIAQAIIGCTTVLDDRYKEGRNGKILLTYFLAANYPLDLVVVMLGSNDLNHRFSASANDVARGASVLAEMVQNSKAGPNGTAPLVLVISPPPMGKLNWIYAEELKGAHDKLLDLPEFFRFYADRKRFELLDVSEQLGVPDGDGLHLNKEQHKLLASVVHSKILSMQSRQLDKGEREVMSQATLTVDETRVSPAIAAAVALRALTSPDVRDIAVVIRTEHIPGGTQRDLLSAIGVSEEQLRCGSRTFTCTLSARTIVELSKVLGIVYIKEP